jgi:CDP-paratose 2-epimerase
MKCTVRGEPYRIYGYKGKQVRDNIHSHDLVEAFWQFFQSPAKGEVYNIGGGRDSNCSVLEAIELCENIAEKRLTSTYVEQNRNGDHIWWISDLTKFKSHYPAWKRRYNVPSILHEIHRGLVTRMPKVSKAT